MRKTRDGVNADGTPHYRYEVEDSDLGPDGEFHLVATGPAVGLVQLADGTLYDVTDHFIAVAGPAHASEVAHHIGVQLERTGVLDAPGFPFRHTDCEHCDAPRSTGPHSPAAAAQTEALRALLEPREA